MSSFNLVVYNCTPLFSILEELKNFFNINLQNQIDEKNSLLKYIEKNPNTLVISIEKVDSKINHLIINKPIKIKELIEKININLSKSNYKTKSNIILNNYFLDINSRYLFRDNKKLKLTQKEVELIEYLNNSNFEKSPQNLQKDIWKHSSEVETHTVETHIYRLRKKINEKYADNNFIINNKKGYKLNH